MGDFAYSLNSVSVSSSEEESTSGSRQSSWPTTGAVDDARPETASEILARLQAQRAQELSEDDREDVAEPTEGGSPRVGGSGRASPVFNSELGDPLSSISSFDDDRLRRSDASEGGAAPAGAVGRTPTKVLGRLNEHASGGGEPHDGAGYSSSTTSASDAGAGYGSDDFDEEDDEDGAADGDDDGVSAPAAHGAEEDSEEGEASLLEPAVRPASPVERVPRALSTSPVDVQVVAPPGTVRDSADSFLSSHGGEVEAQQRAAPLAAADPTAPTANPTAAAVGASSSPTLAARESECEESGSTATAPGVAPIVALNSSLIDAQAAQSAIGVDDGYDTSEEAELREKEAFFAKQKDLVAQQQTLAAAAAVADEALSRAGDESDASYIAAADISVAPPLPQSMLDGDGAPQRSPSPAHRRAPPASPAVPDPSPNEQTKRRSGGDPSVRSTVRLSSALPAAAVAERAASPPPSVQGQGGRRGGARHSSSPAATKRAAAAPTSRQQSVRRMKKQNPSVAVEAAARAEARSRARAASRARVASRGKGVAKGAAEGVVGATRGSAANGRAASGRAARGRGANGRGRGPSRSSRRDNGRGARATANSAAGPAADALGSTSGDEAVAPTSIDAARREGRLQVRCSFLLFAPSFVCLLFLVCSSILFLLFCL